MSKKLPRIIFVRSEKGDRNGDDYLLAFDAPEEAIEDDGPTVVGTYKLVGRRRLVKLLHAQTEQTVR